MGYNTKVKYKHLYFQIQTEDKGESNPTIETIVYYNGEVLMSKRIVVAHLKDYPDRNKRIRLMMKTQHTQIIQELKDGQLSNILFLNTDEIEVRSLDEMVLDFMEDDVT